MTGSRGNRKVKGVDKLVVDVHCAWDDLLIVQSGSGTLRTSRKFKGLARYTQWEWRASTLVEPSEVTLSVGDVVRIPAGDGHWIAGLGDSVHRFHFRIRTIGNATAGTVCDMRG